MATDRLTISQRMRITVPRCLAHFNVVPADRPEPWAGNDIAVWRIACKCGETHGRFLGYPLSRYNTAYSGSEFVGPLAFQCGKCSANLVAHAAPGATVPDTAAVADRAIRRAAGPGAELRAGVPRFVAYIRG